MGSPEGYDQVVGRIVPAAQTMASQGANAIPVLVPALGPGIDLSALVDSFDGLLTGTNYVCPEHDLIGSHAGRYPREGSK